MRMSVSFDICVGSIFDWTDAQSPTCVTHVDTFYAKMNEK